MTYPQEASQEEQLGIAFNVPEPPPGEPPEPPPHLPPAVYGPPVTQQGGFVAGGPADFTERQRFDIRVDKMGGLAAIQDYQKAINANMVKFGLDKPYEISSSIN